jgi:hypothetical protein
MVVFDATLLLLLLRPNSGRPTDSAGAPIAQVPERIAYLVQSLEKAKTRIVIPTPALREVLVRAGIAAPQIVDTLNRSATFRIMPFDSLAAIEAAVMTRAAIDAGGKRGGSESNWAKIKFDRQIVAIAKVARATAIYSDDADVRSIATAEDIMVIGLAELPLPPVNPQTELQLGPPAQEEQTDAPPIIDEAAAEAAAEDAIQDEIEADIADEPSGEIPSDSAPTGMRREQGDVREGAGQDREGEA